MSKIRLAKDYLKTRKENSQCEKKLDQRLITKKKRNFSMSKIKLHQ